MLQVIGEIGGTSSRWAVLEDGQEATLWPPKGERWPGYNPVSSGGEGFAQSIRSHFMTHRPEALLADEVHIYGAGCGAPDRKDRMAFAVRTIWPGAVIRVETDLLGAAIGLCGGSEGLVLILGTGMNAGYFDGQRLFTPMPSLGYLLGDEGSGADIGRYLLQDAFHDRIPASALELGIAPERSRLAEIITTVHQAPHPGRVLASFTSALAAQVDDPYVRELVQGRFQALIELLTRYFSSDQRARVYATGSVAYGFKSILSESFLDHGMTLIGVEPDPLPGLARHHQQQGS